MERNKEQMLSDFLDIVREASAMGPKSFREWTSNPGKYLRPGYKGLPIDEVLRSIPQSELEKIASIVEFFSRMSAQYLLKYLEEGHGPYAFDLVMRDSRSSTKITLIDDSEDRGLQQALRW